MARLSPRDAARLGRVVNQAERTPLAGGIPHRTRRENTATIPEQLVWIEGTIPGRSESEEEIIPGEGVALFCIRTDDGWTREGGAHRPIFNLDLDAMRGPDYFRASWLDGRWTLLPAGEGSPVPIEIPCCPEEYYEVEVTCRGCTGPQDSPRKMPRFFWMEVTEVLPGPNPDCPTLCQELEQTRIRLEYEGDPEAEGSERKCEGWWGRNRCYEVELEPDPDREEGWRLTIIDSKQDCIVAIMRTEDFRCCDPLTSATWDNDHELEDPEDPQSKRIEKNACLLEIELKADPCTCCPEEAEHCPPPDEDLCKGSPCCELSCVYNVWIEGLVGPEHPGDLEEPDMDCELLNATDPFRPYRLEWVGDCHWRYVGPALRGNLGPSATYNIEIDLTMSGTTWELVVFGEGRLEGMIDKTAIFRSLPDMSHCHSGAHLPIVKEGSTCWDGGGEFATLQPG